MVKKIPCPFMFNCVWPALRISDKCTISSQVGSLEIVVFKLSKENPWASTAQMVDSWVSRVGIIEPKSHSSPRQAWSIKNLGFPFKAGHPSLLNRLNTYSVGTYIYSWGKKGLTKRGFRSKTTLITGSVSRTCVNTPFCKMAIFFHRSLALSMPICRNFQSNGAKWRSLKLWLLQ